MYILWFILKFWIGYQESHKKFHQYHGNIDFNYNHFDMMVILNDQKYDVVQYIFKALYDKKYKNVLLHYKLCVLPVF